MTSFEEVQAENAALHQRIVELEERLNAEHVRRRVLFEESPDGILMIDPQTAAFIEFNTTAHLQLGYSREEFAQLTIFDIEARETLDEVTAHLGEGIKNGRTEFETIHRTRQGELRNVHVIVETIEFMGRKVFYSLLRDITERKRVEQALRQAEQKYHNIFENATEAIFQTTPDGKYITANTATARMLGYDTVDDLILSVENIESQFFVDPGRRAELIALIESQGSVENFEEEVYRKDGSKIWITESTRAIRDAQGKTLYYEGTATDITDRKLAADQLRESETKYRELINGMNDTVWVIDFDTTILDVNNAAANILGYTHEELLSMKVSDIDVGLKPEQVQHLASTMSTVKKQIFPTWHITRDGRKIPVEVSSSLVPYMGRTVIMSIARDITERKQAEETLRANEERFRTVADFTYDMEYWLDENRRLEYISPSCERLTGFHRDEFLRDASLLHNIIYPEDRARYDEHLNDEIFNLTPISLDVRMITADGKVRWINHTCQPIYGGHGQMRGRRARNRDITARIETEWNLRASEEKYRLLSMELEERVRQRTAEVQDLYDNAPTGYHSLSPEGLYLSVNQTELNWLGYSREEILGHSFAEFIAEYEFAKFNEAFRTFKQEGRITGLEYDMRRKDGSTFSVLLNAVAELDEQGNYLRSRSTIFDNTERKKSENELRASEETYRALFENTTDAIFLIDCQAWQLERVNPRAPKLLGYETEDEIVGRQAVEFIQQDQLLDDQKQLTRLLAGEQVLPYERTFIRKDGRPVVTEVAISLIRDANGNPRLVQTMARDITQRKQAEEALQRANIEMKRAMRLKDDFMASMSHELRTPLTGILSLAESLQMGTYGELAASQHRALINVENSGRHLLELINDILDLSKLEAGKLVLEIEQVILKQVCQSSLQLIKGMAHKKNQKVSFSMTPPEIILLGDIRRIKQIVVNLLSNAVKYTPEGGSLGLEVEGSAADGVVTLTVWDKGIGIRAEDIERLFQPFVQLDSSLARQQAGTGLGLALVRDLAALHNGSVSVESTFGEGSRFTVTLPWEVDPNVRAEAVSLERAGLAAQAEEKQPAPRVKVMLVEDDELNTSILTDFLTAKNYQVIGVRNGCQFLERVAGTSPKIILMDIQMPDMDGMEAIRRLRAIPQKDIAAIPIIAVTALAMVGDRERCLAAGANEYLSKPFRMSELVSLIEQMV